MTAPVPGHILLPLALFLVLFLHLLSFHLDIARPHTQTAYNEPDSRSLRLQSSPALLIATPDCVVLGLSHQTCQHNPKRKGSRLRIAVCA